tara:strand:- start:796 stop:990 length:195 start_codon:yes stop_codon:yes gene_type:complete
MLIDNKFELGSAVYLISEPEQFARIITDIKIGIDGSLLYYCALGIETTQHYELELSKTINHANI